MPHSLTDLAGLKGNAEVFLVAVLEKAAQPICLVDPGGRIRFANRAAIAALDYDAADELLGRHSHETMHERRRDGMPEAAADWPMLLPRTTGETVARDLDWFVRRDGSLLPVSYVSVPIAMPEGRGVVVAFSDAGERVRGDELRREHEAMLAAQRRLAALVAGGAASAEVFAAIAREVGRVIGLPLVTVWRYEHDGTTTVMGAWGERPHPFQAGTRWPLDSPTVAAMVLKTGRPARIDDLADVPGTRAAAIRQAGMCSSAGAPIIVDGDIWGVMGTGSADREPLPDHIEDRLAEFTDLVATAISNSTSRAELGRLADEQAALRRVATLVAQGVPSSDLFGAVTEEVGALLGADLAGMARYDVDDTVTHVAAWAAAGEQPEVGARSPLDQAGLSTTISRTGRPARTDDYDGVPGPIAAAIRERGIRSSVASPILVEGRLWGALAVHTTHPEPLPVDTESRLASFTELVATAISNSEARNEVAASRARIVAATDEERRRVVRDLHDGAQQRLVHTVITLKLARRAWPNDEHRGPALLTEALEHAEQATAELRELAHGILPAVLTRGGLGAGVDALASRMAVPVDNDVSVGRLPAAVEATAYFVIAEALTNVAKHARARRATVTARVEDGTLRVQVRDDGVGGARPDGSGLVGLADRLAVLDGQLRVEGPAKGGTLVAADLPLP
ncbi:MAG TPA: GAF domain-containing protein [Baekduia sp.]|nr:GAF domain-containing protein [Baekduia sp.]